MNWTLSVIIICIVAALLFTWQEFARADRRRLPWRLISVWLAVAALGCIILPISYNSSVTASDQSNAILLTDGFDADSIPANTKVYTTDKAVQKSYPKAILWSSTAEATNTEPAIKKLKILGYGLNKYELAQLGNVTVEYHAPATPGGIQAISWPGKIKTGENILIQGQYHNTQSKPVKLLLKGSGTGLDSVDVPAEKSINFQLDNIPKASGRVVYQLLAIAGTDTLSNDDIPFEIGTASPIKVLMLNSSPNFESRFLKNWLGQNGYAVASRALISKNKYSEEYVNLSKMDLQHLQAGTLDKFDLVLGDLSAFKELTPAENGALRQQVTQKGLGVIIRADSSDKAALWLQTSFPVNNVATKEQLSVPLQLQGKKERTAKLNIDPSYIGMRSNTQVLASDAQNHILAATTIAGAGKIVFTTLNHTYNWLLAGNTQDYAALWSLLINRSARKALPVQSWQTTSTLPTANEQVTLTLQSGSVPNNITINGQNLSAIQDAATPYEWHINYFATKTGWQNIIWNQKERSSWYNYPKTNWISLKNIQKITETQLFASRPIEKDVVTKQIQQNLKIEIPKAWFYLILLASCTFLWVERKFAN